MNVINGYRYMRKVPDFRYRSKHTTVTNLLFKLFGFYKFNMNRGVSHFAVSLGKFMGPSYLNILN